MKNINTPMYLDGVQRHVNWKEEVKDAVAR
jgi:hypothetical protein